MANPRLWVSCMSHRPPGTAGGDTGPCKTPSTPHFRVFPDTWASQGTPHCHFRPLLSLVTSGGNAQTKPRGGGRTLASPRGRAQVSPTCHQKVTTRRLGDLVTLPEAAFWGPWEGARVFGAPFRHQKRDAKWGRPSPSPSPPPPPRPAAAGPAPPHPRPLLPRPPPALTAFSRWLRACSLFLVW
jgi:hypothetical protein